MSASNSPLADAFGKALEYEALFRYYDKKEPHLFDSCPFVFEWYDNRALKSLLELEDKQEAGEITNLRRIIL